MRLRILAAGWLLSLAALCGCGSDEQAVTRSFYHWKTEFAPGPYVRERLEESDAKVLYIRFFDVEWDAATNSPAPVGQVVFTAPPDPVFEIIPVVYITVESLRRSDTATVSDLALRILAQVDSIAAGAGARYRELQLDCDWTGTTRDKFFMLASGIRKELHARGCSLSATIRLHQVKYPDRTGIPPADRGMLMFYNMGRMNDDPAEQSIYNEADASRYTDFIPSYPLPLDAALPIFFWTLQLRGGRMTGIINKTNSSELRSVEGLLANTDGTFTAVKPCWVRGSAVLPGDLLKPESVSPELCLEAAELLTRQLPRGNRRVALFECDSAYLSQYDQSTIDRIFSSFR